MEQRSAAIQETVPMIVLPISTMHEQVRVVIEQHYQEWRIIQIEEHAATSYQATLASRRDDYPKYILSSVSATFYVTLVNDGPLERLAMNDVVVPAKKAQLYAVVNLMSNGELRVTRQSHDCTW